MHCASSPSCLPPESFQAVQATCRTQRLLLELAATASGRGHFHGTLKPLQYLPLCPHSSYATAGLHLAFHMSPGNVSNRCHKHHCHTHTPTKGHLTTLLITKLGGFLFTGVTALSMF